MYQVRLYSEQLQRIRALTDTAGRISRRLNSVGTAEITMPATDPAVDDLVQGAAIAIYEDDAQRFAGRIRRRSKAKPEEYQFTANSHEEMLRKYKTPHRWSGWNGLDLADVVRDHLRRFQLARWSTKVAWEAAHELHNVDIETMPGEIMLASQPYKGEEQFVADGYVVVRIDLGEHALATGRIARWSETAGQEERVTIQSRSAATEQALDLAPWGEEMTAVHVGEVAQNETVGVPLSGSGRWLDVRINLHTDDQTTPDKTPSPTHYGFSPYVSGLEVIWREEYGLAEGDIPEETGIIVDGYDLTERVTLLRSLADICDTYGWEFRVRHDEAARQLVLDLVQQFGADHTRAGETPVVYVHGRNAKITTLEDDRETMANKLHCWGAGTGVAQLYTVLTDDASIEAYGEYEDDFVDPDAETIEELTTSGQRELAQRSTPRISYEVEVTG